MRGLISGLLFILILLIVGTALASHMSSAAPNAASSNANIIPDQSIRIRIIAKSDSAEDQAVKQAVRDRVSAVIESWGPMPSTIEASRKLIRSHLPDVQEAADETLRAKQAYYDAKVELGVVPFPEKTFEGADYPAGDYEALRITLGAGQGANWWCVLFPPLCLTAATAQDSGDKSAAKNTAAASTTTATGKSGGANIVKTSAKAQASADTAKTVDAQDKPADDKPKAEFFLVVLFKKLIAWIASLFS